MTVLIEVFYFIKANFLSLMLKFSVSFGFACFIITDRDVLNSPIMILDSSIMDLCIFFSFGI